MGSQVVGLVCADRRFGAKRGLHRYIISLWLYYCEITVKSSAREVYLFFGHVKGYPCGDTGVLYVILIGTVGMLGFDENLSRRR
jgi:hypothetical protein